MFCRRLLIKKLQALKIEKSPDIYAIPMPEKENERYFGKFLQNTYQQLLSPKNQKKQIGLDSKMKIPEDHKNCIPHESIPKKEKLLSMKNDKNLFDQTIYEQKKYHNENDRAF